MDETATEIGRRIRASRKAAGLTQEELSARVGLTRSSVANVEAGRQELPTSRLLAVAAALNVTVGQLVGEQPVESLPTVRISTACTVLCDACGLVAADLTYPDARARRIEHMAAKHLARPDRPEGDRSDQIVGDGGAVR